MSPRKSTPSGVRRRPIMFTEYQLSAMATFIALYLDDFEGRDGIMVPRIREISQKVDAELDRRGVESMLVGRDPLIGTPRTVVGPFRPPRGRR